MNQSSNARDSSQGDDIIGLHPERKETVQEVGPDVATVTQPPKDEAVPQVVDKDGHEFLMARIRSCRTMEDLVAVYYDTFFQKCMDRLEASQLGKDRNVWGKEWAEKLSRGDEEARRLNNDRRICLLLLYAICDCWKPEDGPSTVSESDIVTKFKPQKVHRILRACLAMDRANALYNMIDGATNQRGMHWYSKRDGAIRESWLAQFGQDRMNKPTMNKRLTWLFDLEELGLAEEEDLVKLMEPCRTPLANVDPRE